MNLRVEWIPVIFKRYGRQFSSYFSCLGDLFSVFSSIHANLTGVAITMRRMLIIIQFLVTAISSTTIIMDNVQEGKDTRRSLCSLMYTLLNFDRLTT